MLFIFESGRVPRFWMRGMRFALDFVWISEECTVAEVTTNVPNPAPETAAAELPTYGPNAAASYAFEINAGEVESHGVSVGDPVRFANISSTAWALCE